MSAEVKEYVPAQVVRQIQTAKKVEDYAKSKSWGVATNQRLSKTAFWRK